MGAPIENIKIWTDITADMIIDVRSPAEFEEDHIPGAINMPVLDNEQRAEVGTIYIQESAFKARRYGGALVAQNISHHILASLQDKSADFKPLIYCWRGGQRSNSFAKICSDIGWKSYILDGGYKAYRKHVLSELESLSSHIKPILISGATGTGKTRLLQHIKNQGGQILDLEALANHRGSLLGLKPGETQPSQKLFESDILFKIKQLNLKNNVFIEAESSKIGELQIPQMLFKIMKKAPIIELNMSIQERAKYLLEDYLYLQEHPQSLYRLFVAMKYRHGSEKTSFWRTLAEDKKWHELTIDLIICHYDPAYKGSSIRKQRVIDMTVSVDSYNQDEFKNAARNIIENYIST